MDAYGTCCVITYTLLHTIAGTIVIVLYIILDPSCNKYCYLIGQEQVSISRSYKPVKSSYKPVIFHINL